MARLNIKLCKYCSIKRDKCSHYIGLHDGLKGILGSVVLNHNCLKYYKLIPIGSKCKIELFSWEKDANNPNGFWYSKGFATGEVIYYQKNRGRISVKLDNPAWLRLHPWGDTGGSDDKEVKVMYRSKRANKIRLIREGTDENCT